MAWSWSHTASAYADARAQLEALPVATLAEIAQEWTEAGRGQLPEKPCPECSFYDGPCGDCGQPRRDLPAVSADPEAIWPMMEEQATCTNGGWEAWVCPKGCHTVPFAPVKTPEA